MRCGVENVELEASSIIEMVTDEELLTEVLGELKHGKTMRKPNIPRIETYPNPFTLKCFRNSES